MPPSNSVYYCKRDGADGYTEIGSELFMGEIRDVQAKQILLFIHGFSNLPEPDIFPRAQALQDLFNAAEPDLVEVIPLIWPCDNDFSIVKDYWDDQKSADKSAYSFARILERFMNWRDDQPEGNPCLKRINVLCHSMGNRVFRETLAAWDRYDLVSRARNTCTIQRNLVPSDACRRPRTFNCVRMTGTL